MSFKLFKHKGTGNLYYLIQGSIDVKCHFIVLKDDRILPWWESGFVLYKSKHKDKDDNGPYFVRYAKDFYENFEEVKDETN